MKIICFVLSLFFISINCQAKYIKISIQPARLHWSPVNLNIQLETPTFKNQTVGLSYLFTKKGIDIFGEQHHMLTLLYYFHFLGDSFKNSLYIAPEFNLVHSNTNIITIFESETHYLPGVQVGYQFHWKYFFTRIGLSYPRLLIWDIGFSI